VPAPGETGFGCDHGAPGYNEIIAITPIEHAEARSQDVRLKK